MPKIKPRTLKKTNFSGPDKFPLFRFTTSQGRREGIYIAGVGGVHVALF
jgi:hypothetical protein